MNCVCKNFMPCRTYSHNLKLWKLSCMMCGRKAQGKDKEETLKNWEKVQKEPNFEQHRNIFGERKIMTEPKQKHTELPWGIEETPDTLWIGPMREGGSKVSEIVFDIDFDHEYRSESLEERKANAEFIVHACNNHEKLVEALEDCMNKLACETSDWNESIATYEELLKRAKGGE